MPECGLDECARRDLSTSLRGRYQNLAREKELEQFGNEHDSFGAASRQEEAIRARGGGNPRSSFVELRRGFAASRQGGWDWETGDQNSEDFIDLQGHEQNPRAQRYMVGIDE